MSIGTEYRALRKSKGLRIRDVSEMTGVSTSQISNFELGRYGVSLAVYKLLVEALGFKLMLGGIDVAGNDTDNNATPVDVSDEWHKAMRIEELKAEAWKLGYNMIKRQNIERLLPCPCGGKKRKRIVKWEGNEREEILVCYKCGKRASGFSKAEANHNWNEMIKAERAEVDDE